MSDNVNYFNAYYSASKFDIDKPKETEWFYKTYKGYMYARLQQMFSYKNLPDTIPSEMFEYYLLSGGLCFIMEHEGDLYAFQGGLGGEPDAYYRPTKFTVANPALKMSKVCDIKTDGILCKNDKMWMGLDALVSRYAYLMATNLITLNVVDIMLRCIALLSAPDDKTKKSAEIYLDKLAKGELGVIGDNPFFEGIKLQTLPSSNGSYLTQFIELHQYYKGSFYNEIGLNANFNMKREAIGKGEASLSQDSLLPLCDSMLECRIENVKRINEKYGTKIEVDYSSAWKDNQTEQKYELIKLENESSQLEGGETNENGEVGETEVDSGNCGFDESDSNLESRRTEEDEQEDCNEKESSSEDSGQGDDSESEGDSGKSGDNESADASCNDVSEDNKEKLAEDSESNYNENIVTVNVEIGGDALVGEEKEDSTCERNNESS